jgi:hypothetical protein
VTTAASAISTFVAAIASATSTAFYLRTRFIYIERASANLAAVESGYRFFAFLSICHFDEAEAARASGVTVGHDADAIYLSMSGEELPQFVFGSIEIQVANKDILHAMASEWAI